MRDTSTRMSDWIDSTGWPFLFSLHEIACYSFAWAHDKEWGRIGLTTNFQNKLIYLGKLLRYYVFRWKSINQWVTCLIDFIPKSNSSQFCSTIISDFWLCMRTGSKCHWFKRYFANCCVQMMKYSHTNSYTRYFHRTRRLISIFRYQFVLQQLVKLPIFGLVVLCRTCTPFSVSRFRARSARSVSNRSISWQMVIWMFTICFLVILPGRQFHLGN